MLPALIAAGAANIGGGLLGQLLSRGDWQAARAEIDKIVKMYEEIGIPPVESMQVILEPYKQQGVLTPQMEELVTLGDTAMSGIKTDPALRQNQMEALGELERIGDGGLRLSDQAAYEKVLGETASANRGAQDAIVQNMKERGAYGSGDELATRLLAQQESAGRAHSGGLQIAGDAADRALEAILQGGQMSGDIRNQDWNQEASVAKAKDAIAQFNAQNTQGVYGRNTDRTNYGNERNLDESQRIADSNVDTRNMQEQHNKGLIQQNFNNQMTKSGALADAYKTKSDTLAKKAGSTQTTWGNIGQGAGDVISGFAKAGQGVVTGSQKPGFDLAGIEDIERKPGSSYNKGYGWRS